MGFILENILPFFLLLGVLIFVHELGHFLTAKYFGVRVETFCIGFGKKILQVTRGDTTYALALVPLGGYVKMYGDNPEAEIPDDQKKYSFLHQPVWPRIAIVAAGPIVNFIFAIFLFAVVQMIGDPVLGNKIGDIEKTSMAYVAGFRSGDVVKKVDQTDVQFWEEINETIQSHAGKKLQFTVVREESGSQDTLSVTPNIGLNSNILSTQQKVGEITGLSTFSEVSVVGISDSNAIAAKAGLRTFDIVQKIGDQNILYFREILPALKKAKDSGKDTIQLQVSNYLDDDQKSRTIQFKVDELSNFFAEHDANLALNILGIESTKTYIYKVQKDSPAMKSGLKPGMKLVKIDQTTVSSWMDVVDTIKNFDPNKGGLNFVVSEQGKELQLNIIPEMNEDLMTSRGETDKRYTVGVIPAIFQDAGPRPERQTLNPFKATWMGFTTSLQWTGMILMGFVRLVEGAVSAKNISGIITIGRVASQTFEAGAVEFIKMMAIISLNLFLLNLLPIPVLDGGHLVFFTIEALKGAPLSLRKMEIAQTVGLVLLMSLMVFALFNDVSNWLQSTRW